MEHISLVKMSEAIETIVTRKDIVKSHLIQKIHQMATAIQPGQQTF